MKVQKFIHICESCGKREILTPDEAFNTGWDYPPKMGKFGAISPRICGDCNIEDTLWWELVNGNKPLDELNAQQQAVLDRIRHEPESIIFEE